MGQNTKIATCNYCGTRAALVLGGETRHELVCSGCGAPLHDLKAIPVPQKKKLKSNTPAVSVSKPKSKPKKSKSSKKSRDYDKSFYEKRDYYEKRRKPKRKGGFSRFLEEAIDVIEDIFD